MVKTLATIGLALIGIWFLFWLISVIWAITIFLVSILWKVGVIILVNGLVVWGVKKLLGIE